MTDYADLEKRLRQEARDMENHYTTRELSTEAADALASLTEALRAAHQVAVNSAFERDRCGQPDGKMQGATAAVIANDILTICQGVGVDLSRSQSGQDETLPKAGDTP